MTREEHIEIHKNLHNNLDKLVADFITHTENLPTKTTIFTLLKWSFKQTTDPDER